MILEAIVCVGGLILFTLVVEYLTRDKSNQGGIVQYSRGHVPHPIVPEPNNLLEESE